LVVAVGCGDQGAGVADDHLAAEAVGEELVVVAAEVRAPAGEGAEESGWPLGRRLEVGAAAGFGEHSGDLLLGELIDKSVQLVPVGAHVERVPADDGRVGRCVSLVRTGDLLDDRCPQVNVGDRG
jgi:hypothetical protein